MVSFTNSPIVKHWNPDLVKDDLNNEFDSGTDETYYVGIDPLACTVKWSKDNFASTVHYGLELMFKKRVVVEGEMPGVYRLNDEDLATAQAIRNYYAGKIVGLGLRGIPLTPIKKCMYDIVTQGKHVIKKSQIGLLYRLPGFYQEDLFMDKILEDSKSIDNRTVSIDGFNTRFQYIGNVNRTTRRVKQKRFWFRNDEQKLACFYVDSTNNPALPILTKFLSVGNHYRIETDFAGVVPVYSSNEPFSAIYLGQNYNIEECD